MTAAALVTAALLIWAFAVAALDWRQRRVPNLLLLALLLPAIATLAWQGKGLLAATWPVSLLGMAVALAVTLPGYAVSRLGAGDVKLAGVLGLVQGWPSVAWTLMAAALILGAMSLAVVLHLGIANARSVRMPAAVAFAAGFAVVLLWQGRGWL